MEKSIVPIKEFYLELTDLTYRPRPAYGLSRLTGDEHAPNLSGTRGRIAYAALEIASFSIS